jgi:hypothetical protein
MSSFTEATKLPVPPNTNPHPSSPTDKCLKNQGDIYFTKDHLKARLDSDIKLFTKNKQTENDIVNQIDKIFEQDSTFESIQTIIRKTKDDMVIPDGTDNTYFKEMHETKRDDKNRLWLLRTHLFFYILALTIRVIKDESMFKAVYPSGSLYKNTWREDMSTQLQYFKLGIFGSMNATSDIDLGIQYCNPDPNKFVAGLAYIVQIIEDLYLICTGSNSLYFDIETYGNIIFMLNPETCNDTYYLDTSNISIEQYKILLKYACVSVLRNYPVEKLEKDKKDRHFHEDIMEDATNAIKEYYKHYSETVDATNYPYANEFISNAITEKLDVVFPNNSDKVWDEALQIVETYRNKDYEGKRNQYYTALKTGDEGRKDIYLKVLQKTPLTPEEIIKCIVYEAETNSKREESYLLAPTIMHVVRTLQIKEGELKAQLQANPVLQKTLYPEVIKYQTSLVECTKTPDYKLSHAYCDIGIYGYYLSMLEQIGNLIRFYHLHCEKQHVDDCISKMKKYGERYLNALTVIQILSDKEVSEKLKPKTVINSVNFPPPPPPAGGKRRTRRIKKRQTRRLGRRNNKKTQKK